MIVEVEILKHRRYECSCKIHVLLKCCCFVFAVDLGFKKVH